MVAWRTAMAQDVLAAATSVFEGVGQNRHRGEVTRLVHRAGASDHSVGAPLWCEFDLPERVAEDLSKQASHHPCLHRRIGGWGRQPRPTLQGALPDVAMRGTFGEDGPPIRAPDL